VKVLFLGAGAVGLSVAARLSTVCEVHAVTRLRNVEAIRESGFRLTGTWGDRTCHFSCAKEVPKGGSFDYILITAKSKDTKAICRQFADIIRGRETVSLQNGIGNEEIIARFTDRVIGGIIITGFEWRGDGAVHVSEEAAPIKLGRFPEGFDEPVRRLVELINSAGIRVEGSRAIRSDLWGMTLYNCALNPLGAVMEGPYGELLDPASWRIIEKIIREAFEVAAAEGVTLPWASAGEYLACLHDIQIPATARHYSPMLQDLYRGKITEIDFMNGAVVRLGEQHGIPTPVNACICDLIRFREHLSKRGRKL
jgi:2-dehydropantoate 2-reductase